jgi:hypothetical protein
MILKEVVGRGFKKYYYADKDGRIVSPYFGSKERAEKWLNERGSNILSNN